MAAQQETATQEKRNKQELINNKENLETLNSNLKIITDFLTGLKTFDNDNDRTSKDKAKNLIEFNDSMNICYTGGDHGKYEESY